MKPSRLLFLLPLATLSCAQAPVRRLPVVDEMPPAPERSSATSPAGDFVTFYPRVPSMLGKKPDLSRYAIECSEPWERGFFTLAIRDDGKSALFSWTARKVTSLSDAISFAVGGKGSLDWGFVFDRNADGWADYFSHLEGLHPVETAEIAAQVPKRPMPAALDEHEDPTRSVTREEAKLMYAHAKTLFVHYADDDFDGRVDAIVSAVHDPDRWGWLYRGAVVRSRSHSQEADEDWTFAQDVGVREGPVPRQADGRLTLLGIGYKSGENQLEKASSALRDLNAGLRACRIPKGALPRE